MNQTIGYGSTALVILLAVIGAYYVSEVKFSTSFADFFSEKSETWRQYQKYTDLFGAGDQQLVVAIYHSPSVYDSDFLQKVKALSDSIRSLPLTKRILSPAAMTIPIVTPFGSFYSPLLSGNSPQQLARDSLRLSYLPLLRKQILAPDASGLLIRISLAPEIDATAEADYYQRLISLIEREKLDGDLIGSGHLEYSFKRIMKQELSRAALWSFAFVVLILSLLLRNIVFIVASLVTLLCSFLIFYGILGLTGWTINILGNIYPTIILILGVSDCIHFLLFYEKAISKGVASAQAIRQTIRLKGLFLFITSFTTFFGFATLAFAEMPALAQFGLQAGMGVIITFLVTMGVLPGILYFFPSDGSRLNTDKDNPWYPRIYSRYKYLANRSLLLTFGALISVLFIGWGIALLDTNNNLLKSIPTENGLQDSYRRFEQAFGGYRAYNWIVTNGNDESLINLSVLERIGRFHDFLDSLPTVANTLSAYSYFRTLQKIRYPGSSPPLPVSDSDLRRLDQSQNAPFRNYLIDSSNTATVIQVITKDAGRQSVESQVITPGNDWLRTNFPTPYQIVTTSRDLLIDEGHKIRINNLYFNLAVAIVAIAVILGFIFRSWKIPLIALLANLLPLLFVAALMGYFGIELRGTTSIIFLVGFVIAVDDSIHFLSAFWQKFRDHHFATSLEQTFAETGRAILWTTIILAGGFSMLIFSPFWDIRIHGVLISLMLLIALLMDLLILPLCLIILFGENRKKDIETS